MGSMIARLWGRSQPRDEHRVRSDRSGSGSFLARRSAQLAAASLSVIALVASLSSTASAQTWSQQRERPALFEIVAIDETSQPLWIFGSEDIAKDGVGTYAADEAAVDLRSVYADTRSDGLWVRAYVASDVEPLPGAVAFFFLDNDSNAKTGGKAEGDLLFDGWSTDPSPGGYEVAVGMRGDGTALGVFSWDDTKDAWTRQPDKPVLVTLETGKARDPVRLSGDNHGYFQITLDSSVVELGDGCTGPLFVRLWNDATGMRAFGDSSDVTICKARLNAYGDPEILRSNACDSDASCPANGKCRERTCVFEYECNKNDDCRADERCTGSVCVRVVDKSCDAAADCDGLVCASDKCTACSDSGDRACASGYVCTPGGTCIRPGATGAAGRTGGGSGSSGSAGAGGERVRGGAFTCAAFAEPTARSRTGSGVIAFVGVAAVWIGRRRRRLRHRTVKLPAGAGERGAR
jgi:hypothetical protein